jgi:hypothetical protein
MSSLIIRYLRQSLTLLATTFVVVNMSLLAMTLRLLLINNFFYFYFFNFFFLKCGNCGDLLYSDEI